MRNRQGSSGQGQRDRNDSTGVIGKQHGGIRAFQIQTLADIYKADVYGQDHPVLPYAGPDFDDQRLIGL